MSRTFKWHMLITSFIPLWISIVIINFWHLVEYGINTWNIDKDFLSNFVTVCTHRIVVIIFTIIVIINLIISIVAVIKFIKIQNSNSELHSRARLMNVKKCSNLSAEYLIAYILPMLVFDFTKILHMILFVLYFTTLAILTIRNNHVYVNILLEFCGYRIYNADISLSLLGKEFLHINCIVLSRNDLCLKNGEEFIYYDFENTIYLDLIKEKKDDKGTNA